VAKVHPHSDTARLLAVNVGRPRTVMIDGKAVRTAIYKSPVSGRIRLGRLNLDGDGQADLRVHGGDAKAVYAYPFEHYGWWQSELACGAFPHGQFGENFTTEGLSETEVIIGERYRVGGAVVEVSEPRKPCFKLGLRMGREDFPELFTRSARTGFYLRVIEEGEVGPGDVIERLYTPPGGVSVAMLWRLVYLDAVGPQALERALAVPGLTEKWRERLRRRARGLGA
jgi:MOSC domain-containing protein YiiM